MSARSQPGGLLIQVLAPVLGLIAANRSAVAIDPEADSSDPRAAKAVSANSKEDGKSPETPAWLREGVWYGISLSSFHGSEGRDLKGKLPFLKDLGVTVIILRGVFDPRQVELDKGDKSLGQMMELRHVGAAMGPGPGPDETGGETLDPTTWRFTNSDRAFLDLIHAARKEGIRVVVTEGLPTAGSEAFTPAIERYLLNVTERWLDPNADGNPLDGIDGWGIGNKSLPRDFYQRWYSLVKRVNPQAVVLHTKQNGEDVHATPLPADAAIFASYRDLIVRFFGQREERWSTQELLDKLGQCADSEKQPGPSWLVTSLRDGARGGPLSLLSEPTAAAPEGRPPATELSEEVLARWRLATIVHHFLPGAPLTEYGDEAALVTDPYSGGFFGWADLADGGPQRPDARPEFMGLIRWLHSRRVLDPPLREGSFRALMANDELRLFAFARKLGNDETILLVNYGSEKREISLPAGRLGQMIGVLIPNLQPASTARAKPGNGTLPKPPAKVPAFRISGSRQTSNEKGEIRLWIGPMSVRVILVREGELK